MRGQLTIWLILMITPLLGGLLAYISRKAAWIVGTVAILISFLVSLYFNVLVTEGVFKLSFLWFPGYEMGWFVDQLSAAFISLVLLISLMVHLFSSSYMKHDKGVNRYYGFLGFFTFSMIGLLMSDHLLIVFVFWELVGFASYLLIGFWHSDNEKSFSSRYAFITNRIADAGLLMGVLLIMTFSNSAMISEVGYWVLPENLLMIASVGMVLGAFGKSAQFPFFTWLPRAMAGPTPVSALIHAATMVAAGVYLLVRVYPVLPESVKVWIAVFGAITAFLAAISALAQYDIKKVLAYSTVSQLGYMMIGIGSGASEMAFFHLWTHAFFKAGLFLAAGSVIHFMHEQHNVINGQDMRLMGGLRKYLPATYAVQIICMLALAGVPFFTGFFSKEGILIAAWNMTTKEQNGIFYMIAILGSVSVFLTAFYMMRQTLMIFSGDTFQAFIKIKEDRFAVILPLSLLAIGSLWFFYNLNPFAHNFTFLNYLFYSELDSSSSLPVTAGSILLAGAGLGSAYFLFRRGVFSRNMYLPRHLWLLSNYAFGVDHFYTNGLRPVFDKTAVLITKIDIKIIDRLIDLLGVSVVVIAKIADIVDKFLVDGLVRGVAYLSGMFGRFTSMFTAERMQVHIFWLLAGLIVLLFFII